jgi:hypothetical protein
MDFTKIFLNSNVSRYDYNKWEYPLQNHYFPPYDNSEIIKAENISRKEKIYYERRRKENGRG